MQSNQNNRLNEKLHTYWQSLCGTRAYPQENEVEPEALKDIWDSCFLVKEIGRNTDRHGYRYDYLGTSLIQAFGDDAILSREISARLVSTESQPLLKSFEKVIQTGKVVEEESEFKNSQGLLIKYRSCMMPLGNAKEGVNYILGGMKWKAF